MGFARNCTFQAQCEPTLHWITLILHLFPSYQLNLAQHLTKITTLYCNCQHCLNVLSVLLFFFNENNVCIHNIHYVIDISKLQVLQYQLCVFVCKAQIAS